MQYSKSATAADTGRQTAIKQLDTPYPTIDADPHFSRVVRSFRNSDYAAWAGLTGAFPFGVYMLGKWRMTYAMRHAH